MTKADLATYLNDHLAGSVGAIELIGHLIKTSQGNPIEQFCKELCADVSSDQDELRDLMSTLEVKESRVRKASAWIAEKLSRPKLKPSGDGGSGIGLLQALEGLVLGIKGKEGLWRALEAVKKSHPQLERFDFERLRERAIGQGQRVEAKRLDIARQIFV